MKLVRAQYSCNCHDYKEVQILCLEKEDSWKDWDTQAIFEVKKFGRLKLISCNKCNYLHQIEEYAKQFIRDNKHLLF